MSEIIKVVIADDHAMFRQGIISLLSLDQGIEVIGEAANGQELLTLFNNKYADIVLLDIQMPVMNGTQVLEILKIRFPDLKIIMVSMQFNAFMMEEYFRKGADGFIPKGCDIEVLIDAIYNVREKGNYREQSFKLVEMLNQKARKFFRNKFSLSGREIEVLSLTCQGKANKEIAYILEIAERTVEFHKTNLYMKTGLSSSADLISYGIRNGLDVL